MRIKTHIHWKNLGKVFLIFFLFGIALFLLFVWVEISTTIAAFIGVVIGAGIAIICSNHWTLWHFEAID